MYVCQCVYVSVRVSVSAYVRTYSHILFPGLVSLFN